MKIFLIFNLFFINFGVAESSKCNTTFQSKNIFSSSYKKIFTAKDNFPTHHSGFLSFLKKSFSSNAQDPNMENLYTVLESTLKKYKGSKKSKGFKHIEKNLYGAYSKTLKIHDFIQKPNSISKEQGNNNRVVFEAILMTFLKHVPEFFNSESSNKDWPRINSILQSINDFDSKKGDFSLYKIKRSIEGRYSLREYVLCKK